MAGISIHGVTWCCLLMCVVNWSIARETESPFSQVLTTPDGSQIFPPAHYHFDAYEECSLHVNSSLYCMLTAQMSLALDEQGSSNEQWWQYVKRKIADPRSYRYDRLRHGICVRKSCPNVQQNAIQTDAEIRAALKLCYDTQLKPKFGFVTNISEYWCERTYENDISPTIIDWLAGGLIGGYVTIVLLVTFIRSEHWGKLQYLSIQKSFELWLKPIPGPVARILGVRLIMGITIILCHSMMRIYITPLKNPEYMEEMFKKRTFPLIERTELGMQILFTTSAMIYGLVLKELSPASIRQLLRLFLERYIRFAPVIGVIVLFHGTLAGIMRLGAGPMWNIAMGPYYTGCRKNWWTVVLLVNNIFHLENMCMPHLWYIAVDMQLYGVALMLTWFMGRWPFFRWHAIGTLMIGHILYMGIQASQYRFSGVWMFSPETARTIDVLAHRHYSIFFLSTWSHLPSVLAGITAAKFTIYFPYGSYLQRLLWWVVTHLGILVLPQIFSLYMDATHWWDQYDYRVSLPYVMFSRCIMATSVAYFLHGIYHGIGGPYQKLFNWRPWHVLNKLSLCAFALNIPILLQRAARVTKLRYLTDAIYWIELMQDLAVTYGCAVVLYLVVEAPFIRTKIPSVTRSVGLKKQQ